MNHVARMLYAGRSPDSSSEVDNDGTCRCHLNYRRFKSKIVLHFPRFKFALGFV
jgi:hypothetical protein